MLALAGKYGYQEMKSKIIEIQRLVGVTPDGVIGDKTLNAILERLRSASPQVETAPDRVRFDMMATLLNFEDDRITGPASLRVMRLPEGDGGGTYEIAGICDGIEPKVFNAIKAELEAGNRDKAWDMCIDYVEKKTHNGQVWSPENLAIEFFLRDIIFNMGDGGCVSVIQRTINYYGESKVVVDGAWGPKTKKAWEEILSAMTPESLLSALVLCRNQRYKAIATANPKKEKFLKGWYSRTSKAETYAKKLL